MLEIRAMQCATAVAVLALFGAKVADAQLGAEQKSYAVYEVSCLLRIEHDPSAFPLGPGAVEALLRSSGVVSAAAKVAAPQAAEQILQNLEVRFEVMADTAGGASPGSAVLVGRLDVQAPTEAVPSASVAAALMQEMCKQLEASLISATTEVARRQVEVIQSAENEVQEAESTLTGILETQHMLTEASGIVDLSREHVAEMVQSTWERRRALETSLAGQKARRDAIAAQIARISAAAEQSAKGDDIVRELETVVEVRTRELARADEMFSKGVTSSGEQQAAREGLARARAEMLQQRRTAVEQCGGAILGKLNEELVMLTIQTAETEAQLAVVRGEAERLEKSSVLIVADRYERDVRMRLPIAQSILADAQSRLIESRHRARNAQRVLVTVLGGLTDNR